MAKDDIGYRVVNAIRFLLCSNQQDVLQWEAIQKGEKDQMQPMIEKQVSNLLVIILNNRLARTMTNLNTLESISNGMDPFVYLFSTQISKEEISILQSALSLVA